LGVAGLCDGRTHLSPGPLTAIVHIDVPRYVQLPPGRDVAVGDEAVVHAAPGLIALLEATLVERGSPIGAGYQAPLTVPFGIAVTAALGALGATDPHQDRWMVRSAAIAFGSRASGDDRIEAKARVERLTEHDAFVHAFSRGSESGELLTAELRVIALRGGRYAAAAHGELPGRAPLSPRSAASVSPASESTSVDPANDVRPLFRLQQPQRLATSERFELTFEPDIMNLLMHPVAGHGTPLGRRVHPLGGGPFGAALTTALVAAGEIDPDRPVRTRIVRADVTWLLPLTLDGAFVARTSERASDATKAAIDVVGADGRVVLKATVEWTRSGA